ncbi:MAG: hypothetical protein R2991_15860 [Thermoanaerobaculia bacterium]
MTSVSIPRPQREEQALREVGRTDVRPAVARLTGGLLLATLVLLPLARALGLGVEPAEGRWRPFEGLRTAVAAARAETREEGPLAGNRRLLAGLHAFEDDLEETAPFSQPVQSWGQWMLTRFGGVGNERALAGRDGRLDYAPDVAVVSGPGFLDPVVLERRSRSGESWEEAPRPDPRPALAALGEWLTSQDIRLLIVQVPSKAAIEPEGFVPVFRRIEAPLANPSQAAWVAWLDQRGISWLDLRPELAALAAESDAYLERDSHWTPAAMELAARRVAERIRPWLPPPSDADPVWLRREAVVEGAGDLAAMLRLPDGHALWPAQRVTIHPVTDDLGAAWRPTRGAPVLLLGDSFTNVFSDAGLGWGAGAGFAEQLSWELQLPVDRIAQNAGAATAARRALARQLTDDPARLDGVRVVVWELAERELASGDWREVSWP